LLLTGEMAQIESPPAPGAPLSQMCDGARSILTTIDEVVWTINSQRDNLDDFVIYVCKYVQNFLESTAIRCRFDVAAELPPTPLSQLMRRNLFLAVKEAVNNAARHSQATELTVRIELIGLRLSVVVADNGRGFQAGQAGRERNGLTNMKQRMAEIGGDCAVASRPGEGCQVSFEVPLKRWSFFRSLFRARTQNDFAARTCSGGKYDPVPASKAE
jgi:signal transduction histidine kinase